MDLHAENNCVIKTPPVDSENDFQAQITRYESFAEGNGSVYLLLWLKMHRSIKLLTLEEPKTFNAQEI